MIHLNAELWNHRQLCVLQVLNLKETNPARKIENLAKAKCRNMISQCHDIISQCRNNSSRQPIGVVSQQVVICHNKDKAEFKLKFKVCCDM